MLSPAEVSARGRTGDVLAFRSVRVAVIADMLEEGWPSMDLVADSLVRELGTQGDLGVDPTLVRPRLVKVTGLWGAGASGIPTRDRVLNRFWLYRRSLGRAAGADVFHIVDHSYAHLAAHLPPGRCVVTCHDIDAFAGHLGETGESSGLPTFLVRRLVAGLARAALVACPSRSTADALVRSGLVPAARIAVVPNGVDIAPVAGARAVQLTSDLLGADAAPADLLHVGSVIPRKRMDLLLTVFAGVLRRQPAARLIRVGGPFTGAQDAHARRLGIGDRILVLPPLDRQTLAAVYSRSALLISTSEREGFGLPLAESLAAGTPVLATDLPVFREVAGPAATYVPLEDVDTWVEQAAGLLTERLERPDLWQARQSAARLRGSRFSWARYAREMTPLYRAVVSRAAGER